MPRPTPPVTADDYPASIPAHFRERRAAIENARREALRAADAHHARAVRAATQRARETLRPVRVAARLRIEQDHARALDTFTTEYLAYCRAREQGGETTTASCHTPGDVPGEGEGGRTSHATS
jgi:hypothetical protein